MLSEPKGLATQCKAKTFTFLGRDFAILKLVLALHWVASPSKKMGTEEITTEKGGNLFTYIFFKNGCGRNRNRKGGKSFKIFTLMYNSFLENWVEKYSQQK